MIWNDDLDKLEKKQKIDAICKDLLEKLDNTTDWKTAGNNGVTHKDYNIEVYEHLILRPERVRIPRKWKKKIRQKLKKIYHHFRMQELCFLHDVILGKYSLHVWITDDEKKEWLKENAKEDDYIVVGYWYYFKNESIAVAYKLRWL